MLPHVWRLSRETIFLHIAFYFFPLFSTVTPSWVNKALNFVHPQFCCSCAAGGCCSLFFAAPFWPVLFTLKHSEPFSSPPHSGNPPSPPPPIPFSRPTSSPFNHSFESRVLNADVCFEGSSRLVNNYPSPLPSFSRFFFFGTYSGPWHFFIIYAPLFPR